MTRTKLSDREKSLLLVIDGHAMVYRAWFSIPERLSSGGIDTRGAYGFTNTFLKVIRDQKPTHAAIAFDTGAPTFRDAMYPDYKAHRPPAPEDLLAQIPIVKKIMRAFRVPTYEKDGFEADDLIGTFCRIAENNGIEVLIVTGDADQLQLVSPMTRLLMYTGFGETRVYDEAAVQERYGGLGPDYVPELKALEGDPSDNIPGVPGVGRKAAQAVLNTLGKLDDVYANLDQIEHIEGLRGAKRVRKLLEEHQDAAFHSRELTTIVRDVPIDFKLSDAEFWKYRRNEVVDTLASLEFRTPVAYVPDPEIVESSVPEQLELSEALADLDPNVQRSENSVSRGPDTSLYETVTTKEQLGKLVQTLLKSPGFAFDTETTGLNPMTASLVGLSFCTEAGRAWYVPVGHREGTQVALVSVLKTLAPVFSNDSLPKTAHNGNYDLMVLQEAGVNVRNLDFDTMIAAALTGRRRIGLKQLAFDLFNIEMIPISALIGSGRKKISMSEVPIEKAAPYAAADADLTWRLRERFKPEIDRAGIQHVFADIEMPLLPVIVRMQRYGALINPDTLESMSAKLSSDISDLESSAREIMGGREFNLNSTRQVASILIDELGVPKTRRTKTGYTMDAATLEGLLEQANLNAQAAELISVLLKYRELTKLKSTYVDALPRLINQRTGRLHTSFNQVGSATGRLSSTDPNVQNIPVRTQLGRQVRRSFITDYEAGWSLLAADYSQIELRILAHMSQEPSLLKAFDRGEDIHTATAQAIYGVQNVEPEQRRVAKVLNFGVIYGLGAHGVARQTDLSRQQGQDFLDLYFGKYPGIQGYTDQLKQQAAETGYAQTLSGRIRRLPDIVSHNRMARAAAERMAINMPIQGTAADVIKIAMVNIDREMSRLEVKSRMTIQVHDELIFEVAPGELETMKNLVQEFMPSAMDLTVPLQVEVKTGYTWGDLE